MCAAHNENMFFVYASTIAPSIRHVAILDRIPEVGTNFELWSGQFHENFNCGYLSAIPLTISNYDDSGTPISKNSLKL